MTVEGHVFVAVDDEGRPRRAFHTREQAWEAVESDSYADEDLVDVFPDVPVIAEDVDDVECHNCGYEWVYSGSLGHATCPNCGRKTKVAKDDGEEEEDADD